MEPLAGDVVLEEMEQDPRSVEEVEEVMAANDGEEKMEEATKLSW